jgi:hypothetical protein
MCVLWSVLGITAWLCASANAACTADCSHSKVAAFAAAQSATDAAPAHQLRISASGRYLVDQNNLPFLIIGDSPQSLINNLSTADREMYLADRQAHGFNTVWVNLLCNTYTGCRADGTTYDGVAPFTKPDDLATPNETYFARADAAIRDAARHGLVVFLDPIETGGWLATLRANGAAKAFRYGAYLGRRYKDFPNIVWLSE